MTPSSCFSRLWKTAAPISGWCVFIYLIYLKITSYGTRWEFSPRGIPVSKLARDGQHYADGSEVSPLDMPLIQSGYEELVSLSSYGFLVGMALLLAKSAITLDHKQRALIQFRAELEKECPRFQHQGNNQHTF